MRLDVSTGGGIKQPVVLMQPLITHREAERNANEGTDVLLAVSSVTPALIIHHHIAHTCSSLHCKETTKAERGTELSNTGRIKGNKDEGASLI